jgi:8-amino-7-oxononanoate synthase
MVSPFTPAEFDQLIAEDLADRAAAHQLRSRRPLTLISPTHVRIGEIEYVNFASNNYLGLTHHPRMIAAVRESAQRDGVGSGAAALITGYTNRHAAAERAIAMWKGTDDAVLLPSGYQANHAAVQTLSALAEHRSGVRFLVDKLAHASLLDAVRGARAEFRVFPHNHLAKVRRLLDDAPPDQLQVVVTESIFSMDGDAADLAGLIEIKQQRPFILLLDEAHGSGVYGPAGAGYAAEVKLQQHIDISIVTLSKALGCVGGAVCASKNFCQALLNYGRAFIYSTSIPPMVAAAAQESIAIMRDEPQRQSRVRALASRLREWLGAIGFEILQGNSPIIPLILGDERRAIDASQRLADARILVPAVRPPTVPKASSRLRITLSSDHTDDQVQNLVDVLAEMRRQVGFGA